ncbi:carbon-nitrogen hydrolase family protein [Microbacterium sp. NPDC056052]|uniref:carbon-nitrogen hydrolase family protein n=1 Tax=Microbacterium sp. NPDC056052 TaxID=3345695 RepID=UPI0035D9D019
MPLTLAVLQHGGHGDDVDANLRTLDEYAERAATAGADLLLTPEMFVTGYNIGDRAGVHARLPLAERVGDIAARRRIRIAAGLPLPLHSGTTNSVVLLDEDGRVRARYDKTHLFGSLDRCMFAPGAALPDAPVEICGVMVSFLICYDVEFPEAVRAAARAGTELLLVPTAQMEPFAFVPEHLIRVRAWENQIYLAYADRIGQEGELRYVGRSSIVAPSGDVLAAGNASDPALLLARIDPAEVTAAQERNPYLADARAELYSPSPTSPLTKASS